MRFGGLNPFTLSDFPGCIAAIAFTQGCNLRCPFCHNGSLIPVNPIPDAGLSTEDVLDFLRARTGKLDGLVVSGGEPTLHVDLPEFLYEAQAMGFKTKLDTNGTRPRMLRALIDAGLVDYVAMDVKAPLDMYAHLTGAPVDTCAIVESMRLIAQAEMPHEFRTTWVPPLLSEDDIKAIRQTIPAGSTYKVQAFRPEHAVDPSLAGASGRTTVYTIRD